MKRISILLIAALFLASQMGFAATKVKSAKAAKVSAARLGLAGRPGAVKVTKLSKPAGKPMHKPPSHRIRHRG